MEERTEIRIPTEVYSRVVGYFRPVNQWNQGKKTEYKDRVPFKMPEITQVEIDEVRA